MIARAHLATKSTTLLQDATLHTTSNRNPKQKTRDPPRNTADQCNTKRRVGILEANPVQSGEQNKLRDVIIHYWSRAQRSCSNSPSPNTCWCTHRRQTQQGCAHHEKQPHRHSTRAAIQSGKTHTRSGTQTIGNATKQQFETAPRHDDTVTHSLI